MESKLFFRKLLFVLSNRYMIILFFFIVWMSFFDTNSWLIHRELRSEIEKLKLSKQFYEREIVFDKIQIEKLSHPKAIEAFAREHYFFKRKNEEVYVIDCDTMNYSSR